MNSAYCLVVVLVFAIAAPAFAQPPTQDSANLRGDSSQTRKRLTEAEQKLANGHPTEAVEALQRILDDAGDDLVSLDGKHYRPARHFAHVVLARLPADVLKIYQDRLEAPARKLLDQAKTSREPGPLLQLLDRYFVSRPADEGLLLLGDLYFERGEFRAAEQVWSRLLPGGEEPVYPNSRAEAAAVAARMVLAAIFAGDTARGRASLEAYKSKYADAKGMFAGRDGPYADALQAALDHPPGIPPTAAPAKEWPTFAGGPDRSNRLGIRFPNYWPHGMPSWEKPLTSHPRHHKAPLGPPARPPFGHPIIAGGRVFVTDGTGLLGFELQTGKALKLPARVGGQMPFDPDKPLPDACASLSAAGDRIYIRSGPPLIKPTEIGDPARAMNSSALVCFGPHSVTGEIHELWRLAPPGDRKTPIVWEGAPLVVGRRLWAAYARFEGGRTVHGIACYDPADSISVPTYVWSVDVCDSPIPSGGDPRARQELLTLAGRNIVFCSNAGAVVSLDSVTGQRSWGFRYPRTRRVEGNRSPDPSPAVYASGRVFVAPTDAERVYALDPETGRLLWESPPTEGARILGAAAGRLIVAVAGPARGLRGLNLATGSSREPDGWFLHDGGGLLSYGHGFVTEEVLVWPTRAGLYLLRPIDGSLLAPPFVNHLGGTEARYFGNLAYADGVLIVVTPTQIWGYLTDEKRFGHLKERSFRDPIRARFEALVFKAEEALRQGHREAAEANLREAMNEGFPKQLRAWAAARRLMLLPRVTEETMLPADLRAALTPELLAEWLIPADGIPATLETLVFRRLGREPPPGSLPTSPLPDNDRKPEDAPTVPGDAEIFRTLHLPENAAPLHRLPGGEGVPTRLFAAVPDGLIGVGLDVGKITRYGATETFTHVAEIREGFVAAGPFAVAVYSSGRLPVWVFRVPTTEPLPAAPGTFRLISPTPTMPPELSAFRLTGSWLVARLGERHLIAFDLKGRRVAWVLGTNGKLGFRTPQFPDSPTFGSAFAATGRLLIVQLSDGRRWFLRAESGKILDIPGFNHSTATSAWLLPPMEVEANRLAVSDGPGLIRMLNLATGRVKWTHQENREASLSGVPPQVRAWGGHIIVAIHRNHGVEIDSLDMSDGRSVWNGDPVFLDALNVYLSNADADSDRLYVPAADTLTAINLRDGKTAWEAELPCTREVGNWIVKAGRNCIIAYPDAAIPKESVQDVFTRLLRSFRREPRIERLPALAARLYDAWIVRSVPVLLFDPETGKQLNRFDVPASGPAVSAWFERDLAVVATADRVVWFR